MARIIVLGSSNTDLVIRSSRLPLRGETVLGTDYRQVPGGKGANQAVASARAGGAVCFVAAVGADPFGRAALEHYRDEGLEIGYIRTRRHSESGVALILVDDSGANMIAVHGGANQTLSASEIARLPKRLFREAKVFVSQFEIPFEAVRCGLERARKAKCLTILNPAPAQPIKSVRHLLPLVDILIPNESEAAFMTGREVRDEPSAKAAAVQLLRRGCGNVIITLGSRGCLVACAGNDEREITFDPIPALRVRAVDTVGAGCDARGTTGGGKIFPGAADRGGAARHPRRRDQRYPAWRAAFASLPAGD
ncbi:ribokinase [Candidatus Sumerlaeota bacterium]|nr:ribokinase [Candidatus Sumerlaeota bacterium]